MLSKRCVICKKPSDITELFEGIYDNEMVMVCEECSREEKIPILKKPSMQNLEEDERRPSVRERMERMSGMDRRRTLVSKEQIMVQNNLNRLKQPAPKQKHDDVVENYYWEVRMARRRRKLTLTQAAQKTGVPVEALEAIEKGKIPRGFEEYFARLEESFNIKLLKHHKKQINFVMPKVDEEKVLSEVRRKMETRTIEDDEDLEEFDKHQKEVKLKEITDGEFDFSDENKIDDLTLNDLSELKREKEKKEERKRLRKQTEELLGDEIDIEWDK